MDDEACLEALISLMPRGIVPVLSALAEADRGASDLARVTGVPVHVVRHTLKVLRSAGLIYPPYRNARLDGRKSLRRITDRGLTVLSILRGGAA